VRSTACLVALAHGLATVLFVIGQDMCRLVDEGVCLFKRRPQVLSLLQPSRQQALQLS